MVLSKAIMVLIGKPGKDIEGSVIARLEVSIHTLWKIFHRVKGVELSFVIAKSNYNVLPGEDSEVSRPGARGDVVKGGSPNSPPFTLPPTLGDRHGMPCLPHGFILWNVF